MREPLSGGTAAGVRAPEWRAWVRVVEVALPLALTCAALRWLVPGPAEIGAAGVWGRLARLADQHPLAVALGLWLLMSALVRGHIGRDGAATRATRILPLASAVALAAAAALLGQTLVGEVHRVKGASMLPTLGPGDRLLLEKVSARLGRPVARGAVIALAARTVGDQAAEPVLVKRVIGLPGDRIEMRGGLPVVNGWPVPGCDAGRFIHLAGDDAVVGRVRVEFLGDAAYLTLHTPEARPAAPHVVGPGELYVLGDNRNDSRDSRSWAAAGTPLPARARIGTVVRRIRHEPASAAMLARDLLAGPRPEVHLPGLDASGLSARIAHCLANRPHNTEPPAASLPQLSGL